MGAQIQNYGNWLCQIRDKINNTTIFRKHYYNCSLNKHYDKLYNNRDKIKTTLSLVRTMTNSTTTGIR